jgi:hypothetical protein
MKSAMMFSGRLMKCKAASDLIGAIEATIEKSRINEKII